MQCEGSKKILCEIYTTSEESFSVGYAVRENETETLFKVFDELGRECALYVIKKSMIVSLVKETNYLKKMEVYLNYWSKAIKSNIYIPELDKENMFNQVLKLVNESNSVATIRTLDHEELMTGFISKVDDKKIFLKCISMEDATIYDEIMILNENIWFIEFNSIENNILSYAYDILNK